MTGWPCTLVSSAVPAGDLKIRAPKYNQYTLMSVGRIACGLAVVAVLCVLGIFFFPVINGPGPYSAVHGPVTALLSIRAAVRLRTIIVQTGLDAIRGWFDCVGLALTTLSWSALAKAASKLDTLSAGFNTILRC